MRDTSQPTRRAVEARPDEAGQSAVEFALIAPVLVLVLFAILQFGLMFYTYIDLTSATREGARKAAVSRQATDPVGDTKQAIKDSTSVVDDTKNTITVTSTPWSSGQTVTVTSSYAYQLNLMGVTLWNGPMKHVATVRVE